MKTQVEAHAGYLAGTKVVDQHCHIFPDAAREVSRQFFLRLMSLESYNPDYIVKQTGKEDEQQQKDFLAFSERSGETTLFFKESVKELARFLRVPQDASDVLKERNRLAASNYADFVSRLYRDAGIKTLLVSDYPYLPYTDPGTVPWVDLKHKLVIPALVFEILDRSSTFNGAANEFVSVVEECLGRKRFVGIKSMIAYGGERRGSGLDIGDPDEKEAAANFAEYKEKKGKVEGIRIKNLLDYFHRLAIKEATRFRRPVEFHTGIGDTDIIADDCNPMLLVKLLQDEEVRRSKIILLHAGYPYVAEAGWITHFFPNVYLDSSIIYFTHFNAAVKRAEEMLEMAPYSKLLYSSDGMMPELQWFAAKFAKKVMSTVIGRLVRSGTLSESEGKDLAECYFHRNSEDLYSLR